jgi:predicted exporter
LLAKNLETLYSPMGQMKAAYLEYDPLLVFSRYFNAQNPLKLTIEQGIVILPDANRFWALLLTDLEDSWKNWKLCWRWSTAPQFKCRRPEVDYW